MKKVYLCGPINGRSDDDCNNWRSSVKLALGEEVCVDPMRRDYRGRETHPGIATEIVRGDIHDIEGSDVILVYYDQPSVGTAMEVRMAFAEMGKMVVVVDRSGKPLSPWLTYHSTVIFKSLVDAVNHITHVLAA